MRETRPPFRTLDFGLWALDLERSNHMTRVGTRVRDSAYEASTANTTASASGANRYRATPVRKNIGTKTMQMQSVDTIAGNAISPAPIMIPFSRLSPALRSEERRVGKECRC